MSEDIVMKYCAFLRGINVGGVKLKSTEQKEWFEKLGFVDVSTVLATGNIIFSSPLDIEEVKTQLENLPVKAFVKRAEQVEKALTQQPLTPKDEHHIYIFIAEWDFAKQARVEFESVEHDPSEQVAIVEDLFYWQVEKGKTLDTPFSKILGKKKYKEEFTSRNINTLEKIVKKL